MDFDTYQTEAMRTSSSLGDRLTVFTLGLTGEAGEVADLIKKHRGHGHDLDKTKLQKEMGDVLWYLAALASEAGLSLSVIAEANVQKLRARYPDGFTVADSHAKRDEVPGGIPRGPDLEGLARREAAVGGES